MVHSGTQTIVSREAKFNLLMRQKSQRRAMSARKRGRAKALSGPQDQNQVGSPDLSAIDTASFMEGLHFNHGKPLHSTALEEELDLQEEDKRTPQRRDIPTIMGRRGRAVEEMEEESTRAKRKTRPAESLQQEDKEREAGSEKELESGAARQSCEGVLTSDEEGDKEDIWEPNAKKTTVPGLGGPRKSSSGSTPTEDKTSRGRQKSRTVGRRGTHFQVVLEAFLGFCDQYSESVESAAVRQSIHCFSDKVREHLLEQISSSEKLQTVKRENTKVGSLIRNKTQRLLDAKRELMRAERQLWLLQKEETGLKQKLADLKQGQAFLHHIRSLHSHYLEHRADKETYGASSLAALLLETTLVQEVDQQPETRP
uniref:Centromere protein U n=2 Tax=Iconisemion striatum TaxID=60296 RepID=A0A1A7XDG9_9TELE